MYTLKLIQTEKKLLIFHRASETTFKNITRIVLRPPIKPSGGFSVHLEEELVTKLLSLDYADPGDTCWPLPAASSCTNFHCLAFLVPQSTSCFLPQSLGTCCFLRALNLCLLSDFCFNYSHYLLRGTHVSQLKCPCPPLLFILSFDPKTCHINDHIPYLFTFSAP